MSIVSPDEARKRLAWAKNYGDWTPELQDKFDGLSDTVVALWPFVAAWAKRRCAFRLVGEQDCGKCTSCQARLILDKLTSEAKKEKP